MSGGLVGNYIVNPLVDRAKAEISAWIQATLEVLRDFVLEASYSIALVGGGILVLFSLTGSRTTRKIFIGIQLGNILIKALLGENQW